MTKKLLCLSFVLLLVIPLTACEKDDPKLTGLEAKIEQMEQEKAAQERAIKEAEEAKRQEAEETEKAKILAELEAAKAQAAKAQAQAQAQANARPKFGPGNGNNLQGYNEGWLRIHTSSADGRLTLRVSPDQNASTVTEIPNGTDDIYYFNRVKVGEYVWYQVDYNGFVGYLRGDYIYRY